MRQRLLVGAVMVMTVCGWYAAYRTVRLTVTIASELDRANELHQHRGAGPVDDRHGSAWPSSVRFLFRAADRRANRPGVASHGAGPGGGGGLALLLALRARPHPHRRRGTQQPSRGKNDGGRQHDYTAARSSCSAVACAHVREKGARGDAGSSAGGTLFESADPRGVPEHGLFRRRLLWRRGRVARLLREACVRIGARGGRLAGRPGSSAVA